MIRKIIPKINRADKKISNSTNKATQKLIKHRASIVDALNKLVEIFTSLNEDTFDEVMNKGMLPLAAAVGLDSVVFYTMEERDGLKCLGQVYHWDKTKDGLMILDDELRILPNIPVINNWISILSQGGCVRLRKSDYSESEAAFLRTFGVKSILMVPIFTNSEFLGFVSFRNKTNDRYFDEDCADLLHSAARVFSNAINKEKTENKAIEVFEALNRREKMAVALNRAAVKFLSHSEKSFEDTMTAGVKEIADVFSLDRFSVWRNFTVNNIMHVSQIYRWDRESGGTTVPTKGLEDIIYSQLVPRWEKLFASGEAMNGPVKLLPEAALLQSFGAVSAFITPIFINNIFWGAAFLEDLHTERFFEDDSIDMMRSAAFLCANTVIRADMEREIADTNEFTHAALDASPLSFTVFDENVHVIDCNDATLKTLMTTKKYYLEHFYEFSPEYQSDGVKTKDKVVEVVKQALEGEKMVLEWINRTAHGELIPYEVTLTRTIYNGKYIVMGYQYDLRNTKKMMESIREQDELLKIRLEQQELISEISRGFISSGDSEMFVKEAIAKLGRYHKVSMVLIYVMDYQHGDIYLTYYWTADGKQPQLSTAKIFEYAKSVFPEILPDGSVTPIIFCDDTASSQGAIFQALWAVNIRAVIAAPLYVDGRLWGIMSVRQCYMPHHWTENEKEFITITANSIAGVIMRDIYTTKLTEALHKATVASKAKSEFLSNMSHEMRTPLNAITGMTAIGWNAKDGERKDYALDKIKDASTHLLGVINDVLDMSKIETNKLELSPVEFNFEKMLQNIVTVATFRVDEKRQKLVVHIDKEIPQILTADDQRLAQVITNLLSNAVKFTPEEGTIILDTLFKGEENGLCTIQVSVSDTGIGINGEQQKRLFSSFQQAESSTTRKYGGTGLGLAISKSIVEMMGGAIWIESEAGKGSVFKFTIQAMRGAEDKKTHSLDANFNNVRILAVDDDPVILTYILNITNRFGVHCDTAISAEDAFVLLNQNGSYDIYFVDWKMPGMDGIQLVNELKARTSGNHIVIMISATEWNNISEEVKIAGIDKFLSKPIFPSAISEIINEYLGANKEHTEDVNVDVICNFDGRRILLVEDVEINREIVISLLEPTQLEIDCAENGVEAVRMFTETPDKYDLIFMDVQMPEMDGYEATRRIRTFESELKQKHSEDGSMEFPKETPTRLLKLPKGVPIIAMTANVFKEDIEKCLAAGMDSHVGKPLDFKEILERLHLYLDKTTAKKNKMENLL